MSFRQEDFRDAPEKVAAHTSVTRLLVEQRMRAATAPILDESPGLARRVDGRRLQLRVRWPG